ncbi:hypothetical protein AWQ14_20725 [Vibrio parahaemolyticus]|uniref:phage tail-collar fiber domain-containing protein n=1 Tax=Vibrio parahaemolyticus TaxID=670 RepID=UPI0007A09937|nr:phage tail protein [Vibrio parahaemolyticus]KYY56090.1 hypothetical protein AWQ14_20725 [Vibrio parahaemolyticus]
MANSTDKSILTAAGKALLAQLNAEEKALVIDKMIFANVPNRPEYPQPDDVVPTDHIVHQEKVEQRGRLSADSVIYSSTLTSDVGPFDFNWTGSYCSEYGVLVTIDHHALTPKTADEPGVAGNTLVRSVVLEYKDIAEITNITVDASSWQYNATERMKKMDSDAAQSIIDQNGKDWFIEDSFLVTPQARAFNIKAGAGYVSGNRVTLEFDRNVQVPNKPSFIYVDAHREGTPTGEQVTLFDFVVTAEDKDDYIDANGVKHFVCKTAQVLGDGSVSDLRPEGDSADKEWVDKSAAKTFDNIDALKKSNYRYEGKTIRLLGRYYTGDGGKAYFEMKKGATPAGVEFIDLSDGWYLQLVESDWVSVVTLGMSDLHSDNKVAFESIRSSRFKNLTMPSKTFRMSVFRPQGVNIVCAKGAKVELFNDNNPVMAALFPDTVIEDLWIHSTETDLPWQRVECESTHDVRFVRGRISGFKDSAGMPNSWGVLINRSKRVYFEGTEFADNSQADIAVVDGNEDIGIKDCFNSQDDGLIVNFEPNASLGNKRCTVDGLSMRKFYLLVNSRTSNPLDKITVKNSHAKELVYDGADCTFDNVSFDTLRPENVHHNFSGEIDARGTFGIGDNLLVDPHLMVVGASSGNWEVSFSDAMPNERYALFEHENYIGIQLNPLRKHCVVQLRSQHPIAVDESKIYYLHMTGTAMSYADDAHIADHIRLNFYDESDQIVDTQTIRPFRHSAGQKMPVRSEGTFFSVPAGAVSCRVEVANAFAQTKVSTIITAITFHEMRRDSVKFNDILDVYHRLSNGPRRCDKSSMTSSAYNYQLPMRLNDIVSVDSQKQMYRCVDPDTVKDGHWIGTFKEV